MKKKRILSLVLTIGVVLGGTNLAYASEGTKTARIGAVIEENEIPEGTSYISNEVAISIATKAIKEYSNVDASCFSRNEVVRYDYTKNTEVEVEGQKYMVSRLYAEFINNALERNDINYAKSLVETALEDNTPNTTSVFFYESDSDEDRYKDNQVTIDTETGEVIRVAKDKQEKAFKGQINENKIKETIINTLNRANLKADKEIDLNTMHVFADWGEVCMYLNVDGGKPVQFVIDLEDYSVITFYKLYRVYPGEDFGVK